MSTDVRGDGGAGGAPGAPPPPPVVVIAASAGGLASLVALLEQLPADTGAAFVVGLHRLEGVESHLVEILGRATGMPVAAVEDASRPEPNRIFLCPPGVETTLQEGLFRTVELAGPPHRWAVDELFASVAQELGPRAVGVVLSGSGSAGTRGLGEIRAEGGFSLAEEPKTATYETMPRSAVEAGAVDAVAEAARLGPLLADVLRTLWREPGAVDDPEEGLAALFDLLRDRAQRDFRGYKSSTLVRRVRRRMALGRHATLDAYLRRLEDSPAELDALASDLTIKVSGFFRDRQAWEDLDREVLAPLVAERPAGSELRIWVPACSSGEEAYSMAILLSERAARAGKSFDLRIFATDCDEVALGVGRRGRYPEGSVALLAPDHLARHFVPEGPHYRVRDVHRDVVVFSPHDLLHDPPFSRMDLVSCRNLLIYLEPAVQEQVLAVLHFSLREGGGLFLGRSESVVGPAGLFRPVAPSSRIFRRAGSARRGQAPFPVLAGAPLPGPAVPTGSPAPGKRRMRAVAERRRQRPASRTVEEALLARHAPVAVLVDEAFNILYFHGETGRFLNQPRGERRQNLLAMARAGLRAPLHRAVARAAGEGAVAEEEARLWDEGRARVLLTASPAVGDERHGPRALVTFQDLPAPPETGTPPGSPSPGATSETLEEELGDARDELQGTIAELEASNEELQASNEEITSMNEELQATNEELQTSQDELQSVNEELATVNAQLEAKVTELERAEQELDALTHELERRVERRTEHLRLLHDVAVLANSARSREEASRAVVARVCRTAGWDAGHACWVADDGSLDASQPWHLEAGAAPWAPALQEASDVAVLPPGTGLPGRVAATAETIWAEGGLEDPRLDRLRDPSPGIAVAFPVLVGDEVVGVLEFLGVKASVPRTGLLELMVDVGTQIGRVVERDRADRKVADLTFQEQQRLGEELHEGLGQQVSALAMLARSLHKRLSVRSDPDSELAAQLEENLQSARKQVQGLSKGLMPVRLLRRGLPGVLGELAEEVRASYPIACDLEVGPDVEVRDDRVATALYRIAREAVNNALRHARASRISLLLCRREGGVLVLRVEDDGRGLPDSRPDGGGLGLRIMQDRAELVHGDLVMEPGPEGGTRVECRIQEGGCDGSP